VAHPVTRRPQADRGKPQLRRASPSLCETQSVDDAPSNRERANLLAGLRITCWRARGPAEVFATQVWSVGRLRSVRLFHVEHETALHDRARGDRRYRSGRSRPSLAQFDSGTAPGMLGLFADSRPSESSSRFRQRDSCGSCPCGTVARSGIGASSGYVCDGSTVSRETRKQLSRIRELGTEPFSGKGGAIREK
jgi:hypothetical protein